MLDNRSVTEKVNEVLVEFSHKELKKEMAKDKNEHKHKLLWALSQINSCIGEVEKVINKVGETKPFEDSFKRAPAFDGDSMNFHVFPMVKTEYDGLVKMIDDKRCDLVKAFNEVMNFEFVLSRSGSGTYFAQYSTWYRSLDKEKGKLDFEERSNLYRSVIVYYHGSCYVLNLMRFCQNNGQVNCRFGALQYDCILNQKGVNATADTNVCDVCYPFSSNDGDCHVNSVGNICYNPHISFYDKPETILNDFKKFIKKCDELISEKNKYIENEFKKV